MSFVLASAARATTGARSGQEDAFRLWPAEGVARPKGEGGGLLAVLADGMGGHTGGAVAGQTACSTFAEAFSAATTPYEARLQSALNASNEALAKGVEQNAALKGMGCTLIGAWMDEVGLRWTSVGDSLLLLYRFPDVIRLNADHSLGSFLDEQARQNRITVQRGQAAPQPQRAALGTDGLQDRPGRSEQASRSSCARAIGSCLPATASARWKATRSPTSSTISASPRPTRWPMA